MNSRLALQTFTVRKFLKSPAAIERCFARIKAAGINAVELAYIDLKADAINAVAQACEHNNMVVGSSQISFDFLNRHLDFKRIVDSCIASSVHYMAIEQATTTPLHSVDQSIKHRSKLGYNSLF